MSLRCPNCRIEFEPDEGATQELPADGLPEGFSVRPMLRLAEVEKLITESGFLKCPPSRQTLIRMIDRNEFEGKLTNFGWIIYEDSFWKWAGFEGEQIAA